MTSGHNPATSLTQNYTRLTLMSGAHIATKVQDYIEMDSIKLLILAGGRSSRMGSPKHLLQIPSTGQPLYTHIVQIMHAAFPSIHTIHISLTDQSSLDDTLRQGTLSLATRTGSKCIELKTILDESTQDIGPAAGLLAAHRYDPSVTWLIVACDFPLLDPAALRQLVGAYEDPVTSFVNRDGFSEPLFALWSPLALKSLRENVESGRSGPNYTVKRLKGKLIAPAQDTWIFNTNIREEWEVAKLQIKHSQSIGGL